MTIDRHHRAYTEKRNAAKRAYAKRNAECGICKGKLGPIDYQARAGSSLAFDLDHIVSIANGGALLDVTNWQPSHATCNRKKGAGNRIESNISLPKLRRTVRW